MRKDEESRELKERMSKLSDEQLLNVVEVEPYEYRKEALDYAKAELMARGIQFQEAQETSDEEADSTISDSKVMRKLITCQNVAHAGLLKGLLTGSGIACEIRGDYLSMAFGGLPFTERYPELWVVGDEDFKRAKEILDEWQRKEVEQQESWICQGCGEENEGQFSSCWRCGWLETGSKPSDKEASERVQRGRALDLALQTTKMLQDNEEEIEKLANAALKGNLMCIVFPVLSFILAPLAMGRAIDTLRALSELHKKYSDYTFKTSAKSKALSAMFIGTIVILLNLIGIIYFIW